MNIARIPVFSAAEFRRWLEKNHDKHNIVELVIHKKHTGKPFPRHIDLMYEGICFGWIDTVIRKIDSDKYIRTFQRRNKNSKWSQNTLRYAKQLIKEGRMTLHGLEFYHEGRKKKAFDHGIPKNPEPPEELLKTLKKSKKAMKNFSSLGVAARRTYIRWILMAKLPETKKKRMKHVVSRMLEPEWKILKF